MSRTGRATVLVVLALPLLAGLLGTGLCCVAMPAADAAHACCDAGAGFKAAGVACCASLTGPFVRLAAAPEPAAAPGLGIWPEASASTEPLVPGLRLFRSAPVGSPQRPTLRI